MISLAQNSYLTLKSTKNISITPGLSPQVVGAVWRSTLQLELQELFSTTPLSSVLKTKVTTKLATLSASKKALKRSRSITALRLAHLLSTSPSLELLNSSLESQLSLQLQQRPSEDTILFKWKGTNPIRELTLKLRYPSISWQNEFREEIQNCQMSLPLNKKLKVANKCLIIKLLFINLPCFRPISLTHLQVIAGHL